ncbi:hypothetical protein [Campylobacter concisus]|uniref:Uncharacterized protein n=1 Tax=Campylobacter concisus TaxID=199 RepID=A0A7S9WW49_9BACT|nr:hypothetical protein [Campylobacter concisus]QPH95255.1 hypothetical protein CVT08_07495 [Campylobacter concisus]
MIENDNYYALCFSFIATGLVFFNIAINKKVASKPVWFSVAKWLMVLKMSLLLRYT